MRQSRVTKIIIFVFSFLAISLLIASFFVPPTGVIDGSVLAGCGEIFGFSALLTGLFAIEQGTDFKLTHGNTTIEAQNDEKTNGSH